MTQFTIASLNGRLYRDMERLNKDIDRAIHGERWVYANAYCDYYLSEIHSEAIDAIDDIRTIGRCSLSRFDAAVAGILREVRKQTDKNKSSKPSAFKRAKLRY